MARPTEQEKLAAPTSEVTKGAMHVKGERVDIDIVVETKPNASGGYDTKLNIPVSPLGSKTN